MAARAGEFAITTAVAIMRRIGGCLGNSGTWLRLLAVPAIWGGTFIAGRIISLAIPPTFGAFLRYVIACVALVIATFSIEGGLPKLTGRQRLGTFLLGVTGIFAYNLFFFGALARLPASRTSLIIALNPVVTIGVASLLPGERLAAGRWVGVALALVGVWIVVSRGDVLASGGSPIGVGELLMFGGVCAWAAYTLIGRRVLEGMTPLGATTWAALWGTPMLALTAIADLPDVHARQFSTAVVVALLYLGVVGTAVAFVWYYRAVRELGAARTVIFNNLVPVFGTLFGVLLLGEPLLPSLVIGGVIALAGVMLVSWPGRRRGGNG
jgi:drug/metabolite transporter (DMT)-like permease